ncbi:pyridoxal phosphate homeostasis protein-like [Juglans regia]|nr:pyridoxal phosphate homeostasis protein-like [Juglans regia]
MATSAAATEGVAAAFRFVLRRAHLAVERFGRGSDHVRVVAVSKTKPVSLIRQVYDAEHRCSGENYVQELIEKAPQTTRRESPSIVTSGKFKYLAILTASLAAIAYATIRVVVPISSVHISIALPSESRLTAEAKENVVLIAASNEMFTVLR